MPEDIISIIMMHISVFLYMTLSVLSVVGLFGMLETIGDDLSGHYRYVLLIGLTVSMFMVMVITIAYFRWWQKRCDKLEGTTNVDRGYNER